MRAVRDLIADHPIASYVVIAFAVTYVLTFAVSVSVAFGLVALFGPAFAAIVVSKAEGSWPRLRARITGWRRPVRVYVLALLIPFGVAAVARLILVATGQAPEGFGAISAIEAVIFILVINNCRGDQKQAAYEGYIEDAGAVATESAALGAQLNDRLTTPGIRLEALRSDVEGLREQQEQILRRTQDLSPPGPLVEQQEALVETMQFRVNGLAGLARGLQLVAQTDDPHAIFVVETRIDQRLINEPRRGRQQNFGHADVLRNIAEIALRQR